MGELFRDKIGSLIVLVVLCCAAAYCYWWYYGPPAKERAISEMISLAETVRNNSDAYSIKEWGDVMARWNKLVGKLDEFDMGSREAEVKEASQFVFHRYTVFLGKQFGKPGLRL